MATTNIQSFAGDVEVSGELTVTGQLNSVTGSDKVKLTATTSNETDYIPVAKSKTGAQALYTDSNLTYNPANNVIAANLSGNVSGNVSGNAAYATNAAYANSAGSATNASYANSATHANNANTVAFTDRDTSNNTDYIAFVDTHTAGDKALFVDQNLTYNSSTNQIGANLSGNVTGNVSGNAAYANNAGLLGGAAKNTGANANSIANAVKFTARDASNNTDYIAFVDTATAGDKSLFTDQNLTYNSSTNHINANVPYATNAGYANSAGSATNATFANNATNLGGRGLSEGANASSIVARNASGDIYCRLLRPSYTNQNNISGAMAYRVNNGNDNYVRFCSNTGSIRGYLNVPTRTGGDASGTWSINVNGNAAYANSAGSATNAAYANNAGNVHIGSRDSTDGNTHYPIFSTSHGDGQNALYTDSNMYYNPANAYLNVNASYAGSAGYANSTAYATNAGYANYSTYTGYPTAGATIQRGQYTWRNSQYSTYSANFVDLVTLTANAFEGNRGHRWLVIGQFNTEQPGSGYDAAEVRINGANVVAASKTWERGVGGTIVSVSSDQTGNWTNLIMQVRRVSSDDILYCNNCSVIAFQQKT